MSVEVSVIVNTRNRPSDLLKCLTTLLKQTYRNFEVIIVDAGSNAKTHEMLEHLPPKMLGKVRVLRSKEPIGASAGRNWGAREAKGKIVAFTDDDVEVPQHWLERIVSSLKSCDVVAGVVKPLLQSPLPSWWRNDLNFAIGVHPTGYEKWPLMGSNFAAKKEAYMAVGGMSEDLGPKGVKGYYEDADFRDRVRRSNYRYRFDRSIVVFHKIPEERLKTRYLLKRARADGESLYRWKGRRFKLFLGAFILWLQYALMELLRPNPRNKVGKERFKAYLEKCLTP